MALDPERNNSQDIWPEKNGNPEGQPDLTDECSFMLYPDSFGGIGVFAAHPIKAKTKLRLYDERKADVSMSVRQETVPGEFIKYCLDGEKEGWVIRPADFGCMEVVWYLNHSDKPNACHRDYVYYALRDIAKGEQITIDYSSL